MTPQELKNSILQLAIQGRLVEQRPEEGTAQELYHQIQAEKRRLIKEGKVKKEKPLPEITEDEKPFEIPESWMWIRLGKLVRVIGGVSYKKGDVGSSGIRILRGGNIQSMKIILDEDDVFLPFSYKETEKQIQTGDILIVASTGSKSVIGKAGYVDKEYPDTMIGAFLRICRPLYMPTVEYLRYLFGSDFYRKHIRDLSQGTNINNVKESYITEFVIPLPPLAEQKRIVAKIDELLPLIDRYEAAWTRLEDFNRRFPEDMKKSILQQAIQGKLVEQRPEEGAAQELYQQIRAEKQRLIKEGKIKKEKPLPEIAEDEKPFDIPEGWMWVRLNYIAESIVDCPHSTPKYLNMETEYCTIDTNCINEKGNITKWRYIDANTYIARIARLAPQKDDIIYTREGSICRAAILPKGKKICLGQRVMLIRCAGGIFPQFLRRMLMTPMVISKLTEQQKGIGAKHVNVSDVCNLVLPLPPLAEQKRIVARLEELLPLCERLKS